VIKGAVTAACRRGGNVIGILDGFKWIMEGRTDWVVPLDEAAVEVVLDLSGRPYFHYEVDFPGEKILGDPPFDPQLVEEFWRAFVMASGITLHIVSLRGRNTHHIIEATFKGLARTLRDAVRVDGADRVPSTKGVL